MSDAEKASWWHDDGIFRYRKSYSWEPIQPVISSARKVIEAFQERDRTWQAEARERREAWEALPDAEQNKPWVTNPPPPRRRSFNERPTPEEAKAEEEYLRNLVEFRNRQWGRFHAVWDSLANSRICEENRTACNNVAFPLHQEPDYSDLQTAGYYHETFCWEVALRSAFRVLDLFGVEDAEFPAGWIHVVCPTNHPHHVSLVASASYQMGMYFAKAQALQRVPQVCRSLEMTKGRKEKIGLFGETVMQACAEMHAQGIQLQKNKASRRVLEYLIAQGKAESGPKDTINGEDAPSGKINRYITKFLISNGLKVRKMRSAKKPK